MLKNDTKPIHLVINADDYGFFACVSRGIIACIEQGAITATAVMANGPYFGQLSKQLLDSSNCDIGAHLNLTYGRPITKQCQRKLASTNGNFADKLTTASLLLRKKLSSDDVKAEWQAQIERILDAGLKICFLNSHEHVHILAPVAKIMADLAENYSIVRIRKPRPEWKNRPIGLDGVLRNLLMWAAVRSSRRYHRSFEPRVLGIGVSGKLTIEHLHKCFKTLKPGNAYELMCHPGFFDPDEVTDHRLRKFHAWEQELNLLTSDSMRQLLKHYNIRLRRFSELSQDQLHKGDHA